MPPIIHSFAFAPRRARASKAADNQEAMTHSNSSHSQLPERRGGLCVSTVSIVCGRTGHLQGRACRGSTAIVPNGTGKIRGMSFYAGVQAQHRGRC